MRQRLLVLLAIVACSDPSTAPRTTADYIVRRVGETGVGARLTPAEAVSLQSSGAIVTRARRFHPALAPVTWALDRADQNDLPLSGTQYYNSQRGAGVRIYVLGSGVNMAHPEFEGRASLGIDFTGGAGEDCLNHETGVASMAAGATTGIAPEALVINVRFANCFDGAYEAEILAAIDWLRANVVLPAVANLSWGEPAIPSDPVIAAVEAAVADGIVFTTSAGNNLGDACFFSPAAAPNALTAAGSTITDARYTLSNQGPCIDLFAPGHDLTVAASSMAYDGNRQGTSYSAPLIAGAAALLLSVNPTWTPAQVAAAITSSATTGKITGITIPGTPNLLLKVAASQTPPFADASFTTVCQQRTCTFSASQPGIWKIGYTSGGAAYSGSTVVHVFPFAATWTVRHTVLSNAVIATIICNNQKCRLG